MKNCFFPKGRPARTPPPTFLFLPIHLSNSPGTVAIPTLRLPEEPSKLVHPSTIGCRFTVPVRSFRGAQSRRKRTARRWVVYRLRPDGLSTGIQSFFDAGRGLGPISMGLSNQRRNHALIDTAPHSGHIPGSSLRFCSRDGIAHRGHPAAVFRPINEAPGLSLTGQGSTGIVPAPIQAANYTACRRPRG